MSQSKETLFKKCKPAWKFKIGRLERRLKSWRVIKLLPKLASPFAGFFYPRLDRTNVQIHIIRQVIILNQKDYLLINMCVIPKLLQTIRNICIWRLWMKTNSINWTQYDSSLYCFSKCSLKILKYISDRSYKKTDFSSLQLL